MSIIWNSKDLVPPPTNRSKTKVQAKDVLYLHSTIENFLQQFETTKCINQEAALLSRVIYRMKYKFRSDKGFKGMEKVNRALLQYLNMNYVQDLRTFVNTIDTDDINNVDIYLPTKQMLEYLLVRTQGFSKLMQRIVESCEITAQYMSSRICIGQSWNLALLVLSNISRINFIANHLMRKCCEFYGYIFPYLEKLQPLGVQWLTEDYSFPSSLYSWLNIQIESEEAVKSLDNIKYNDLNSVSTVKNNIDLGVKIQRETFEAIKEPKENKQGGKVQRETFEVIKKSKENKQGVKVQRETFEAIKKPKENKHAINNIKDFDSLKAFMKKEDKYRKSSSAKSLTKHVDLLQWKLLQKLVCKYMKKMTLVEGNKKSTMKLISKITKILKNNIEN